MTKEVNIYKYKNQIGKIQQRTSFSFKKSRIGRGYYIKLLFIFSVIIILTWLSRQNFSDFLERRKKITVYIQNDLTLLTCVDNNRTATKRVFATDQIISFCHPELHLQSSWELYSIANETDFSCAVTPPQNWYICNTINMMYPRHAKTWPEPEIMHAGSIVKSENHGIIPVDTTQYAYLVNIDSVIIVIISAPVILESKIAALLFEKTDIVILRVPSLLYAESVREALRPRLLISTSVRPEGSSLPNCVFTEGRSCAIELQITSDKKITYHLSARNRT